MGEDKALDNKLKAMEERLDKRLDKKSKRYSGYWSLVWATVSFIILSLNYGRQVVDASIASLEFIINYFG